MKNLLLKKMALFMAAAVMGTSVLPHATVLASESLFEEISGTGSSENGQAACLYDDGDSYEDEEALGARENVKGDGYWHFSDGVLSYNSEKSGAIEDFNSFKEEHQEEIKKVVIQSGPKKYSEDYSKKEAGEVEKCNFLPNLEEVVYESPITLTNMCVVFKGMYRGNPKLRRVEIGSPKEGMGLEIDQEAFRECPSLNEVVIGKGVWYIGKYNFNNDTSLTEFTFPEDIRNIRGDTFACCPNMREIKLSSKNEWMKIVDNAAYEFKDPFKSQRGDAFITPCLMYVPEGIIKDNGGNYTVIKGTKDIQWGTFRENLSIENVTVASTVVSIQPEAFCGSDNLKTVTLPRSLKRVGQYAFSSVRKNDVYPVAPSMTDIYYEGTEEEWKKIKFAEYDFDKGHIDRMSIKKTTTLYDHLESVGIPADVKIHYNSPIQDTQKDLNGYSDSGTDDKTPEAEEMIPSVNKVTISYNGPGAKELSTLGAKMEMTYTDGLTFCGRKHVLSSAKPSASAINDIVADAVFKKVSSGETTSEYKISKVKIKNAKNAADKKSAKPPYFIIQIKATNALSPEDKAVLKEVNKALKKDPAARFYFTINPMDVSSFTEGNIKGLTVDGTEAKIKKVGYKFSYMKAGTAASGWKYLKQCKNNEAGAKGDYTLKVSGKNVILTGQGNYKGSVMFTQK